MTPIAAAPGQTLPSSLVAATIVATVMAAGLCAAAPWLGAGLMGVAVLCLTARTIRWPRLDVFVLCGFVLVTGLNLSDLSLETYGASIPTKPIAALLLAAAAWGIVAGGRSWPVLDLTHGAVAAVLAAGCWSVLTARDQTLAMNSLDPLLTYSVLGFAIALIPDRFADLRWVAAALVLSLGIVSGLTLLHAAAGAEGNGFFGLAKAQQHHIALDVDSLRYSGPFDDPNSFARILLIGIPFAAYGCVHARLLSVRLACGALGLVQIGALGLTYSRGGMLGLAVVAGLAAWRLRRYWRVLAVTGPLVAGTIMAVAPGPALERVGAAVSLVAPTNGVAGDQAISNRLEEMRIAWRIFRENPLLGIGLGNYQGSFQQNALDSVSLFRKEDRQAHSRYLEVASEQGVVGLGALVLLYACLLARAWRSAGRVDLAPRDRDFAFALALALVGYFVASLFLHDDYPKFFWILVGLALALPTCARTRHVG